MTKVTTARLGDLREMVWGNLMREHAAAYPLPCHGHHPNFRSAAQAAKKLIVYLQAQRMIQAHFTVFSYPDYVLRPLRKQLLEQAINVVVPAKYGDGYRFLDSSVVSAIKASSIAGAERWGEKIQTLPSIDMAIIACVGVSNQGAVLDKGYGFLLPESLWHLSKASIIDPLQQLNANFEAKIYLDLIASKEKVTNLSETKGFQGVK